MLARQRRRIPLLECPGLAIYKCSSRSISDLLLNKDYLRAYIPVLMAFISGYTSLCGAVTFMGTLAVTDANNIYSATHNNVGHNANSRNHVNNNSNFARDGNSVKSMSLPVSHDMLALYSDNFFHRCWVILFHRVCVSLLVALGYHL